MGEKKAGKIDQFFASRTGKIFFNRVYSWGAAIVIFGAMFKILHLPYGNEILMGGMLVEVFVFFIAGFDNPVLREEDEDIQTSSTHSASYAHGNTAPMFTPEYAEKMSDATRNMEDFSKIMNSLNDVSLSLLSSYQKISTASQGISDNSNGFAENIKGLNSNVSQLNNIYEAQLSSIANQIETVKYINDSLHRIKQLYDGTISDSTAFKAETEKMTRQIESLNQVYARLLQAMTTSNNPLNS